MVERLIGKGGHAEVYKGTLPDGQIVAVKRITKNGKKDENNRVGDFLTELGIIAHINHPNAAKLIGFSSDGGLHLVLQFSTHGSLASVLHGAPLLNLGILNFMFFLVILVIFLNKNVSAFSGANESVLDWKIRFRVAIGVAEGLNYLHCECQRRIIHRDITASNILLTEDYEPQVFYFLHLFEVMNMAKYYRQLQIDHVHKIPIRL